MNNWISVKDKLPDNDDMMLVTCKTKTGIYNVNRAYFSDGFWHGCGSMSGVIAWMVLPDPYKEDTTMFDPDEWLNNKRTELVNTYIEKSIELQYKKEGD